MRYLGRLIIYQGIREIGYASRRRGGIPLSLGPIRLMVIGMFMIAATVGLYYVIAPMGYGGSAVLIGIACGVLWLGMALCLLPMRERRYDWRIPAQEQEEYWNNQ